MTWQVLKNYVFVLILWTLGASFSRIWRLLDQSGAVWLVRVEEGDDPMGTVVVRVPTETAGTRTMVCTPPASRRLRALTTFL